MKVDDRVFLKLAKKVGYPSPDDLARVRRLQLERAKNGKIVSLFDLAREEKALTAKQQKNFDRWAQQIEAKERAALVEDEETDPPSSSESTSGSEPTTRYTPSGRIVAESAADFGQMDGEDASEDVDDLIRRFAAKKVDEAPEKDRRTPSAGRIRTASAGRVRATSSAKVRTTSAGRVGAGKGRARDGSPGSGAFVFAGVLGIAVVGFLLISPGKHEGDRATAPPPPPRVAVTNPTPQDPTPPPVDARPVPRPFGSGAGAGSGRDDAADARAQARQLVAEARALLERGDIDGARFCVDEARSLDPSTEGLDELARRIPEAPPTPGPRTEEPSATEVPPPPRDPGDPGPPMPVGPASEPGGPAAPPSPEKKTPTAPKPGETVVERFDDGKVKAKYATDSKGRRTGEYLEYHPNGKPKIRARYQEGKLSGTFAELWPTGKPKKKAEYRKDLLHGRLIEWDEKGKLVTDATWMDGKVIYPRSIAQIVAMLAEIEQSPVAAPPGPKDRKVEYAPMDAQTQARPIRRVRQHRWLCGVPWDVDLSFEYGEFASAAARLLDLIGHLDHTPGRPGGCSESLYKFGYEGTSHGNLYEGVSDLIQCIDGWMDDSDPSNIDRVGHRRWLLNPPMKKTAIGQFASKWTCIYAHDSSRTDFEEPAIVRYPAAGFFPTTHIHADAAWSVSLSGARFAELDKEKVEVTVSPCDERLRKGPPAELNYFTVNNAGFGQPRCVIFRPKVPYRHGAGYWVEVKGVKDGEGKPFPIEYYVEFFNPSR